MSVMISAIFLLAAGQPPADAPATDPAAQQQPAPVTAPAPEPKMICKYEHATGSRLQKSKVCRPEGAPNDAEETKLQRQLDKFADKALTAPGIGN